MSSSPPLSHSTQLQFYENTLIEKGYPKKLVQRAIRTMIKYDGNEMFVEWDSRLQPPNMFPQMQRLYQELDSLVRNTYSPYPVSDSETSTPRPHSPLLSILRLP